MSNRQVDSWKNIKFIRYFFSHLVGKNPPISFDAIKKIIQEIDEVTFAKWLISEGLGALSYASYRDVWQHSAELLQNDMYSAIGEFQLHQETIAKATEALKTKGIRPVALKGIGLAHSVYPDPTYRTMSDVDLLISSKEMEEAVETLTQLGYLRCDKLERPALLQQLAGGEIPLTDQYGQLLELHWSAFPGWWAKYVTHIDEEAILSRKVPLTLTLDQLEPEDNIIQLAFHLAVNHHLSLSAMRGLVDIALIIKKREVNWFNVINRAKCWRLKTVLYVVLILVRELIGLEEVTLPIKQLEPSYLHRWLLNIFITPQRLLEGKILRFIGSRHFLLLILVDRSIDRIKLIGRTLWPEKIWLQARYGRTNITNWEHILFMIRHRSI